MMVFWSRTSCTMSCVQMDNCIVPHHLRMSIYGARNHGDYGHVQDMCSGAYRYVVVSWYHVMDYDVVGCVQWPAGTWDVKDW